MCNKHKRLVILIGAGFPLMWKAPSSTEIKQALIKILEGNYIGKKLIKRNRSCLESLSFEYIIAEIESLLNYGIQSHNRNTSNALFKTSVSGDVGDIWSLYSECINEIIRLIAEYETNYHAFGEINNNLCSFFDFLKQHYQHINCYSLNYDEILPKILNLPSSCCALNNELFTYNYSALKNKQITYHNIHGSIYLSYKMFGFFRRVVHQDCPQYVINHAISQSGGNPHESLLFMPIITGYNKSQRVISSHFSFPLNSFINDLSESDTFLSVGYSFSDPHINSQIHQYLNDRAIRYFFITLEKRSVYQSDFEHSFESVIGLTNKYKEDSDEDEFYIWESPQMITYKRGFENFIMSSENWNILI